MNPAVAHATTISLETRIHVLWKHRVSDRRIYGAAWPQGRWDRHVELRALVRLARQGRRLAREAAEREDAITQSKQYADWTESELAEAFA